MLYNLYLEFSYMSLLLKTNMKVIHVCGESGSTIILNLEWIEGQINEVIWWWFDLLMVIVYPYQRIRLD